MDRSARKALIRQYKQTPKTMGVFGVCNTTNGKLLIGAVPDVQARLNRHRAQLRMKGHPNRVLQDEWIEYGEAAFEFQTLDVLEPVDTPRYDPTDDLTLLEELWLEKLQPFGERGYN